MNKDREELSYSEMIEQIDPTSEVEFTDRFIATLNAFPWVGGVVSTWMLQNRQQVVIGRIEECLLSVVKKLERIDSKVNNLEVDEEFAELSFHVLEMATKTLDEQKREYFANILANAAILDAPDKRQKIHSMAILLNQLEETHVLLLDRLMDMPHSQSVLFFGPKRSIPNFDVRKFSKQEHYALGTLEELGLIDLSNIPVNQNRYVGELVINSRGLAFHEWITEPK